MSHYKVETKGLGTLASEFPHSPEDFAASMQDYLEAMFSGGWEFVSASLDSSGYRWFFKANAQ